MVENSSSDSQPRTRVRSLRERDNFPLPVSFSDFTTKPAGAATRNCRYTGPVSEEKPRVGMSSYAKAGAYSGLALITPISGWICYKIGQYLNQAWNTSMLDTAGLILGCGIGMYETVRQATRIEGLDKKK